MTMWRNAELEAVFDGPLDNTGLTVKAISRLITERVKESEQLDFKVGIYDKAGSKPDWNNQQEFAKDVSAFANHRGGILLLGVQDVAGAATTSAPIKVVNIDVEERRLRTALANHQAPPAACHFEWIDAGGGSYYVAIIIPPSPRSPHAVVGERSDLRRTLNYPVRHGADTMWLTESEVAQRYRARLTAQNDQDVRLGRVVRSGTNALRWSTDLWLYTAIAPESGIIGRLDRTILADIDKWYYQTSTTSPLGRQLQTLGRGIPAPGCVAFTQSKRSGLEDATDIRDGYVELHIDGGAFIATPVEFDPHDISHGRKLGERALIDNTILTVDVALRWASHRAGSWGNAILQTGYLEAGRDDGELGHPMILVDYQYGSANKIANTRTVSDPPETTAVADLGHVQTFQERLSVTYQLLSGLLQWFGLANPSELNPDGAIAPMQYSGDRGQVEAWARGHGVATF